MHMNMKKNASAVRYLYMSHYDSDSERISVFIDFDLEGKRMF